MIQKVFAVYDSKLGAFFNPFLFPHEALAKRAFAATANDPNSQICHHPSDFSLFEIAEWNDATGEFSCYPKHINHGLAGGYKVREYGNAEGTPQPLSDATPVQPGSKGGNSEEHVQ